MVSRSSEKQFGKKEKYKIWLGKEENAKFEFKRRKEILFGYNENAKFMKGQSEMFFGKKDNTKFSLGLEMLSLERRWFGIFVGCLCSS